MEAILPIEGSFGNKFPWIYNHCAVMGPEVARRWKNSNVSKKRPFTGSFHNSVLKRFTETSVDLLCSNFVKFGRREVGEIVPCLRHKKNKTSPGSPVLAIARITPKICRGQPPRIYRECSRFHLNRFTFGRVIPERVNTVKARSKVNPIFGWRLKPSFKPNNYVTDMRSSRINPDV